MAQQMFKMKNKDMHLKALGVYEFKFPIENAKMPESIDTLNEIHAFLKADLESECGTSAQEQREAFIEAAEDAIGKLC